MELTFLSFIKLPLREDNRNSVKRRAASKGYIICVIRRHHTPTNDKSKFSSMAQSKRKEFPFRLRKMDGKGGAYKSKIYYF